MNWSAKKTRYVVDNIEIKIGNAASGVSCMILYKYLSLDHALAMLESSTVGFTQAPGLNDPSETTAARHIGDDSNFLRGWSRRNAINWTYSILSLTRNPLNAIMWSHYCDGHRGLVVGIDCSAAGLNDEITCVLPARYGSVIYSASKPVHAYFGSDDDVVRQGGLYQYQASYLEALQRMFLYKSAEWNYEEEVRVVKTVATIGQMGGTLLPNSRSAFGGDTWLCKISPCAIYSVHVGIRAYDDIEQAIALFARIHAAVPNAKLFDYSYQKDAWGLKGRDLGNWENTVQADFSGE
jgi:hypothetical protein